MKRKTSTWLREHGVSGLMLQSWDRNGAYGYWIVEVDRSASASSPGDMALNTNWMRRTGWAETFAGADRKLLVQLAQIPHECRLSYLVTALDRVFDRCEDTARHTDVSIRCLLRSSYPDRTYKAPYELVGRKATTEGYRRLFKKAVCFCVRFWRLDSNARQKHLKRSPTYAQNQSFRELWCDDAWAAMPRVQEAEPHRREPSPEPVSPFDAAWLSEDCFDDIGSTYIDSSDEELEELQEVPYTLLESRNRKQQDRTRLSLNRCWLSKVSLNLSHERGDVQSPDAMTRAEWPVALEDPLFRFVDFFPRKNMRMGSHHPTHLH
ncbi:hypothetical protein EJ02DRAFT_497113 [Clathrospora elynae]|uniref:Uncharacterized protein n=1 Tax=Clathrospora elynae TaxID=706981 RepID=A0A6A5SFP3_9PLEO|nr:hypothetical protein EJ02DRAFT_497113 [Clathrospora elynae]